MNATYAQKGIYKYNHFEFQNYESQEISGEIPINRTFFNNGLLPIPPYVNRNFDMSVEQLEGTVFYKGNTYSTKIVVREKGEKDVYFPNDSSRNYLYTDPIGNLKNDYIPGKAFRGNVDYFSSLGDLQSELEEIFSATKFVSRMRPASDAVNIGEKLLCKFKYVVKGGKPTLYLAITEAITVPDDEMIDVMKDGRTMAASLCRELEKRYAIQSIPVVKNDAHDVAFWRKPMDWIQLPANDSEKSRVLSQHDAKYAMYMWTGHKPNCPDLYVYIGIVGTDRNENNTVGKRIMQEQKNGIAFENDVIIDRFRYAALSNNTAIDTDELLKTVEMQCINAFSAFLPYTDDKYNTPDKDISPLLTGVVGNDNVPRRVYLLNRFKRYHHENT